MAKKPTSRSTRSSKATAGEEAAPTVALIADDQHPDHVGGLVSDPAALTPLPDGPLPPRPQPFPMPPSPVPIPMPFPGPFPEPFPEPRPLPLPTPIPWPLPLNICMAVSGRYRRTQPVLQPIPTPFLPLGRQPLTPLNLVTTKVRVDVDRFFPQRRISIEVNRLFPQATSHAIAEVTSDVCLGFNNRRVTAMITFRDGLASLIPGTTVVFEASRTTGINYDSYQLTLSGGGISPVVFPLSFESQYFDPVEFEVDRVANAGTAVTTYDTGSHPNRPAGLAAETISLATVYQRAGFDVTMSPNTSVIPTTGAGANGTWSDGEMHNAMVTFWSRFANLPQWAMWVLYAARHDTGRSLGGIMFDDIGANHRQGTAIFTDSFIQDVPAGDANPAAWRQRMVFWTAVHEMGHGFNLAHAWQKSLGTPWIPLADEPEARSFMNYPFRVAGGQASFFSDFRFRFSDDELIFMRHAPRRFVQMGNANWFVDHGFEGPPDAPQPTGWELEIRPNRAVNEYAFLEPVNLELKLTNTSGASRHIEEDLLTDGRHIAVLIGRDGGLTRRWNPMITRCHEPHDQELAPGASIYGAHLVSASTSGWLIDEPGFYRLQAAVDVDGAIVVSNVLRIFVSPPATKEESQLAPDYFTEDVGRAIAFDGAPELAGATDTLREVTERAPTNPAARHAAVAVSTAMLRDYKRLDTGGGRDDMEIRSTDARVEEAAKVQMDALVKAPEAAAETIGHICYFADLDRLAGALEQAGDEKEAAKVLKVSVATMKKRGVLDTVIAETQDKLNALT